MTEARKGDLAVAKVRHSYTMRHGPTEATFTYEPVVVMHASLTGKICKARNGWNSPVTAETFFIIPRAMLNGRSAKDIMGSLAKEYDTLEDAQAGMRAALMLSTSAV